MQFLADGRIAIVLRFTRSPAPFARNHDGHKSDFLLKDFGKLSKTQDAVNIFVVLRRMIQAVQVWYEEKSIKSVAHSLGLHRL